MESKPKILFCVLNWGLGHATRSIPIIQSLQKSYSITIASDGIALELLQNTFPDCVSFALPGYNIKYSAGNRQDLVMAFQIPRILKIIKQENELISEATKTDDYVAVISDNRYGCYSKEIPSVFIGHQLQLVTPILKSFINRKHDDWLDYFKQIWQIAPGKNYFPAFAPSEPVSQKTKALGWVSRFNSVIPYRNEGKVVFILSGPEPQRTIFEEKAIEWAQKSSKEVVIIAGKKGRKPKKLSDNIEFIDYANADQISTILSKAKGIICRSGYTSIMDWSRTQTPVFFCPTPGQPEQEYLARFFEEEAGIQWVKQDNLPETKDIPFGQLPMYNCDLDFAQQLTSLLEGKSEC